MSNQSNTGVAIQATSLSYQSPIPPPEILQGYDNLIPNGADRILKLVEQQAQHRMELEKTVILAQQKRGNLGQWMGFVSALSGLGVSAFLGFQDHDVLAGTIASTTIIGLVYTFVLGRKMSNTDLQEKNQ